MNLQDKTVKELRNIAKEFDIVGRWDMTKEQLISAINNATISSDKSNESIEVKTAKDQQIEKNEIETAKNKVVDVKIGEVNHETNVKKKENVDPFRISPYIEKIQEGMIIAFRVDKDPKKIKSAKVLRKSTAKRRLKVENKVGMIFVIDYDDVLWVKTGKRWPRNVYNLLKGKKVNRHEKSNK